jgi:hypothetical protein
MSVENAGATPANRRSVAKRMPPEVAAIWAIFAAVALADAITYARVPPHDLYHVSGHGLGAGLGRALVFVNFPTGLAAVATLPTSIDRGASRVLAVVSLVLCALVVWPSVVSQADLDAKWINALPAIGVAIAVALSLGRLEPWRRLPLDRLRAAFVALYVLAAVPWIAAVLGFGLAGVPVLGSIWQTTELRHQPGVRGLHPAVHHGEHHGLQGLLLATAAILLFRVPVRSARLEAVRRVYLSLLVVYAVANSAQDFWLEQAVKRGWTRHQLPSMLRPELRPAWAVLVAAAALVALVARAGPGRLHRREAGA